MHCPVCGQQNRPGRLFCAECGGKLVLHCPSCRSANAPDEKFCGECGKPLSALRETGNAAASYTPKYVAEKILASRAAMEGERKQVTVLFADVKGSMDMSADLDPEEWHGLMDRFFTIMSNGVHRFEGTVNQYTGDGIMALFGAPIAHEDHAQAACRAALHLRDELAAFHRDVERERGISLAVRMGLNSGAVIVGTIGDDLRTDYTALGHTVGLAARMEQMAQGGSILVTEYTAALVGGLFRVRDLGARAVKGVARPIHVFELEDVGDLRSRLDVLRARRLSRFVGRAADMAMLETALERALDGNGSVVGIVAEPGVGKSRLCSEFVERCSMRGVAVYETHCPSHTRAVPFQLVQQLMRAYCDIGPHDGAVETRAKIAEHTGQDAERRKSLPLLFEFLGVPDPDEPSPRLDPEVRQRRLFTLVRQLMVERCASRPIVVIVDDLQWTDPGSEAFMSQLEPIAGMRLLVVANFRPEYHSPWSRRSYYQELALRRLGPDAASALLGNLLGEDPTLRPVMDRIRERTEGNAFFIEETARSLVEDGYLDGAPGSYRLARDVTDLRLPATIEAVLTARIDRLVELDKDVLQAAAVIGREFDELLLQHVTALRPAVLAASLARLCEAEFVFEVAATAARRYAFGHPLGQEVAYHEQLNDRRSRMHGAVARAIEALGWDRAVHAEALAYHHGHSLEREHAVPYHELAGDKASAAFSLEMARHQYGSGVRLLDTLEPTAERMMKRIDLTSKWADAGLHGPTIEQVEAMRRSFAHAEQLGDLPRATRCMYWIAFLEYCLGNQRESIAQYDRCIAMASGLGLEPLAVRLRCNLGHSHALATDYAKALELLTGGTELLRHDSPGSTLPYSLGIIGLILGDVGRFPEAYERFHEGLRILEALERRSVQLSVYALLATAQLFQGRWSDALTTVATCQGLTEKIGAPSIFATTQTQEGFCRFHRGETRAGLRLMVEAVERLDRIQTMFTMSFSLGCCAEAFALDGQIAEARTYAERALARAEELDRLGEVMAHRALLIAAGREPAPDLARVRRHYEAAMAAAARKAAPRDAAITDLRFGEVLLDAGRGADARPHLERALATFESLDMLWYGAQARRHVSNASIGSRA
jgi:class 3 adenylate cyclase/tetratricopeptide (TPR) repeat protein